jgi:hypothetical protein
MARGELHVQLAVNYADDEKFEDVSRSARLLYVDALCLSKNLLNDGEFSRAKARKLMYPETTRAADKAAAELVAAGLWLWDPDRQVFTIAAWLKRNKSRSQVEQDRKEAEDAALLGNHRRWHVERQRTDPKCRHCLENPSPPRSGTRSGAAIPTESPETETETETETKNKEQPPVAPRPARRPPEPPEDHDGQPGPAEQLVTAWINSCNRRPSRHVINDVGKLVAEMLQDDIPADDIERGIRMWQDRGSNPRTLPSYVNQVMNARPSNVLALPAARRPSTTDQRVNAALELAAKYAQEDLA